MIPGIAFTNGTLSGPLINATLTQAIALSSFEQGMNNTVSTFNGYYLGTTDDGVNFFVSERGIDNTVASSDASSAQQASMWVSRDILPECWGSDLTEPLIYLEIKIRHGRSVHLMRPSPRLSSSVMRVVQTMGLSFQRTAIECLEPPSPRTVIIANQNVEEDGP